MKANQNLKKLFSKLIEKVPFLQTWKVINRCRKVAEYLLQGWQLTHEGYACLMGLNCLRHWNSKRQTKKDKEEKRSFEEKFWQYLEARYNALYKKAIDLYQPFTNSEDTKQLFAVAIAPGVGAQRHGDMVLITESGNEVLSRAPNGFLRID